MTPLAPEESFSLFGGPLKRWSLLLARVTRTRTVAMGIALGWTAWVVLVAIALLEDVGDKVFSMAVIGGHVRLLLVIPLFFLCESFLDPRATAFVRSIVASKIVPPFAVVDLRADIARIERLKSSWVPDVLCLVLALGMSLFATAVTLPGTTLGYDSSRPLAPLTVAALWYWLVCLPLFRFLALRWLWHLGLWTYFLWRLNRLQLALVPTHPDRMGGLGYLEVVHAEFSVLIFAISAAAAATFAESMFAGTGNFSTIYPSVALLLIVDAALFLAPMCVFSVSLWMCRVRGLENYMDLGSRYVGDFDRKWVAAGAARPPEPLLGTQDLQALADLGTSLNVITEMQIVPASRRLLVVFAAAAVAPLLPLLLFRYPLADLAEKLFQTVFSV